MGDRWRWLGDSPGRRRRETMAYLMWYFLVVIVRVILTLVGVAAGLVALAITAIVALVLLAWRGRRRRHKDDGWSVLAGDRDRGRHLLDAGGMV
jgi:hypothetical protein